MGMQTSRIFPVQESKNAFARFIRTLVAQSNGEGTDLPSQGFSTLIHTARRDFSVQLLEKKRNRFRLNKTNFFDAEKTRMQKFCSPDGKSTEACLKRSEAARFRK